MKIKNVKMIHVSDWDQLVKETYNRPYNFQQQDGCKSSGTYSFKIPSDDYESDFENDTVPENVNHEEMGVSFAAWLARDPLKPIKDQKYDFELELWWERNFYPCVDMVIKDLHEKGLLEAGDYVINIDW